MIQYIDEHREEHGVEPICRTLAGIDASVGSVGDAYDNALAESAIGLYKTELIWRRSSWRTFEQVEYAPMEWIDWYNLRRLHSACGYRSPAAYEDATTPVSRRDRRARCRPRASLPDAGKNGRAESHGEGRKEPG